MNTITVENFWELYGKNHGQLSLSANLPPELSFGAFFDQVFGNLTRHDVRTVSQKRIHVVCTDCLYVKTTKSDICESHIGLIKGLLNTGDNGESCCHKTTPE